MSSKYAHSIRDAIDGVDSWRSDLAGLIELLDATDPRLFDINKALIRLRESRDCLSSAIQKGDRS